ncbi:BNR repeat-containing protein [Fulvivirga sediminis]|uniref:BNR repeat-containing protein n=1 Tax=Fulvivirga sediminis TaxID=2803949 RepID=A0A937FCV2_9BACT|nr:BNR repeat-containing protein [Fulvivirga sediminis]MBL3658213.1 BNR repeat-containing protein [Fulvivirga sediminis]
MKSYLAFTVFFCISFQSFSQTSYSNISKAWSKNSVNAVIFRKNSLVTYGEYQFAAYYYEDRSVVLAKRKLGNRQWEFRKTQYFGNAQDAHNTINIIVDGDGYLHVAWDQHNNQLHYAVSNAPLSLDLGAAMSMTEQDEDYVTYPEFYKMPSGDLTFLYRNGESGSGNLVLKRYNLKQKRWEGLQRNLIDGENERNAYWQAIVDNKGVIHLSWVWRETWDVATNHDMCYARSRDGGKTWEDSKGKVYQLPINQANAEIIYKIPQNSGLINQTSMTVDAKGNPIVATYFKDRKTEIQQYQVIYFDGSWHCSAVSKRKEGFDLGGGGTKKIPISRPQILYGNYDGVPFGMLIYRDQANGNKASVYINPEFPRGDWFSIDLWNKSLGDWEPTYDSELWRDYQILSLFVQNVEQVDGEGLSEQEPSMVYVLDFKPYLDLKNRK